MILRRIIAGLSGNIFFQAMNAVIQLFGVPVCLKYWGNAYYGEWLLLFTIPAYLSISDFGLGTSSASEMAMMNQDDRRNQVPVLLRSVFWIIVIWALLPFGILLTSNYVWPWYEWLKLAFIQENEFRATFPLLILYIYVSLFLTVPLNYYRVIRKYHVERYISTVYKVLEFCILLVMVMSGQGVFAVALGYLLLRIMYFFYIVLDLYRRSDQFRLWPVTIRMGEVKKVFKPGVSGLFFSLGGNILNQGISTIIGLNFGPQKLVMFNTIRILVNLTKQIVGIINLSVFSEFSYAFGAGQMKLLQRLFRGSMTVNILLALTSTLGLLLFSEEIVSMWTNGQVELDAAFTFLFILYAFLGVISAQLMTLLSATNQFQHTGFVYLILVLIVVGLNSFWVREFGLPFVAISLIISEALFLYFSFNVISNILKIDWIQLMREISVLDFLPPRMRKKNLPFSDQQEENVL